MKVDKAQIVAILRSQGLDARADWVERALPEVVDTDTNHSLLATLRVDPEALRPVDLSPAHS
jgi:hypothetical protein